MSPDPRTDSKARRAPQPSERLEPSERDWLALQWAGALRPAEAVRGLRASTHPRDALAFLPSDTHPNERELLGAARTLARSRGALVPFATAAYPERLAQLADPPPVLAVRGATGLLTATCVAIVGSRAATAYGLTAARRIAGDLARVGIVIVSGLARGIDAAAHEAALAAGGTTIAVQACGLDVVYPASHRRLADRIAAAGAVVTEFPPGARPRPAYFPLRNRLISGLSRAVVVVEARERSGSLTTARHAADQGVDVFAVPGPVRHESYAGSNGLLRDGAAPALDVSDVLGALGWSPPPVQAPDPARPAGFLGEVLDVLAREPASPDALARRLGRDPGDLAGALTRLELEGWIISERDGLWHVAR